MADLRKMLKEKVDIKTYPSVQERLLAGIDTSSVVNPVVVEVIPTVDVTKSDNKEPAKKDAKKDNTVLYVGIFVVTLGLAYGINYFIKKKSL